MHTHTHVRVTEIFFFIRYPATVESAGNNDKKRYQKERTKKKEDKKKGTEVQRV